MLRRGDWRYPGFISTLVFGLSAAAHAGVPQEVADRLGNDLTPMGSQKAGNKAGTIPEWTGGLQSPPAHFNHKAGDRYKDPYPEDKILFTITSENAAQYEKNLSETSKALFATYPGAYKMNVYPGRRSCAQPTAVYDTIKKNALTSAGSPDGAGLSGAIRSTAFPIPGVAQEIMWNHKLKFRNFKLTRQFVAAAPTRGGDYSLFTVQDELLQHYSDPAKNDVSELENISLRYLAHTISPSRIAGNVLLVHENINQLQGSRKAWIYSPGMGAEPSSCAALRIVSRADEAVTARLERFLPPSPSAWVSTGYPRRVRVRRAMCRGRPACAPIRRRHHQTIFRAGPRPPGTRACAPP